MIDNEKEIQEEVKSYKVLKIVLIILGILIVLFSGLYLYMRFIGTTGLEIREYKVVDKNLPQSFHGFKVVHFTDLHYKTTVNKKELNKLVKTINKLKPDVVVFTGDLVDKHINLTKEEEQELINGLNKIKVTTSLYAVKGNHDYYSNSFDVVFSKTNFKVLDNDNDLIYYKGNTPLLITGTGSSKEDDVDLEKAFNNELTNKVYTISLIHEPDIFININKKYKTNLVLGGHSHNGQVRLPFIGAIVRIEGCRKYANEHYKVGSTDLYISGGVGTSGQKIRFFNRPSINLYRLVEK